ncbi:MAG: deoxyribodipyrimidine photo-lyase [Ferruginibacter sp.]
MLNIFWFRRDLRLEDNAGLYHALRTGTPVLPVFIFDTNILNRLEDKADKRIQFIHDALAALQAQLLSLGSSLRVFHSTPAVAFETLASTYTIGEVFANHDYEPYARTRDMETGAWLREKGIGFHTYKDQVIFEKDEVLKDDGHPYTVFTPYSKRWKALLNDFYLRSYPTEKYFSGFFQTSPLPLPSIAAIGFQPVKADFPDKKVTKNTLLHYKEQRDFPALPGTSRLSVHLRFGTVSIRELVRENREYSETYLNELIWREFYQMILWHFPQTGEGMAFKPAYDQIEWRKDNGEFEKWCQGKTGYPIVDAGMRELNATGYMHNRVRMIVASFLSKHLLLDWRLGEAYFAQKLLDFDLAANNGGWQWAAGSGCDAAPYFRIFNPYLQTQKFDGRLEYIRKWVPELDSFEYPAPMVEHELARKRCLEAYGKVLKADHKIIQQ